MNGFVAWGSDRIQCLLDVPIQALRNQRTYIVIQSFPRFADVFAEILNTQAQLGHFGGGGRCGLHGGLRLWGIGEPINHSLIGFDNWSAL